jgi:hypothetical protein
MNAILSVPLRKIVFLKIKYMLRLILKKAKICVHLNVE